MYHSIEINEFRKALSNGNIIWRKHLLQKLAERGIQQNDIITILINGECIQDYPDDKPYPSALFLFYYFRLMTNRIMLSLHLTTFTIWCIL